jgi:iron(III) transport system permease protein
VRAAVFAALAITIAALLAPLLGIWLGIGDSVSSVSGMLLRPIVDTTIIAAAVGTLAGLIGTTTAWLIACYDFRGRALMRYMLVIPLIIPAYVSGYIYHEYLAGRFIYLFADWIGLGRTAASYGWGMVSVILILTIACYPYVYIVVLNKLNHISDTIIVSRTLGHRGVALFTNVMRYAVRPTLLFGMVLVIMEVITEYGVTSYYGINTCVNSIYRMWFNLHDYGGGALLSLLMLATMIAPLIFLSQILKSSTKEGSLYGTDPIRLRVSRVRGVGMLSYCMIFVVLGFVFPVAQLLIWGYETLPHFKFSSILPYALHSLQVAALVASAAVVISLLLSYALRRSQADNLLVQTTKIGYAIPGSVVAIGVLRSCGGAVGGSILGIVYACLYRFIGIAHGVIHGSFKQISTEFESSLQVYSTKSIRRAWEYFTLVASSSSVAFSLVFIDMVKELPATLIIRPFNYDTLATRVHELVADERYKEAAIPSLAIVLLSMTMLRVVLKKVNNGSRG